MDPVLNFAATTGDSKVILGWQAPDAVDFAGARIQYDPSGYPADYTQGTHVVDVSGSPGNTYTYVHTSLTNGTTYYYGCFAYNSAMDDWALAASSSQDSVTPCSPITIPPVSGEIMSDFESGIGWGTQLVIFDQVLGDITIPLLPSGEVS